MKIQFVLCDNEELVGKKINSNVILASILYAMDQKQEPVKIRV